MMLEMTPNESVRQEMGGRATAALSKASAADSRGATPENLDRAAQSAQRATSSAPAALVTLSPQGKAALHRSADAEAAADAPAHDTVHEERERPPPAPQKKRVEARPSEALARYRQVAEDPASIFIADNSPFRMRAAVAAPADAGPPPSETPSPLGVDTTE